MFMAGAEETNSVVKIGPVVILGVAPVVILGVAPGPASASSSSTMILQPRLRWVAHCSREKHEDLTTVGVSSSHKVSWL